jgi:DNA-binding GntR family transcriptional regulator
MRVARSALAFPGDCDVPVPKNDPVKFDRGLRRRLIVQTLLTDVFEGRLKAGDHLVTQTLAKRFGVSHTPIREALIGLSGIGIVDLLPNRGAVVRRLAASDVREICQVRRALESEATRGACGRIDPGDLEALADGFRELSAIRSNTDDDLVSRAGALDGRLHDLIAVSCGNGFLAKELDRLKILFRAFRDVSYTRDEPRFVTRRLTSESREHLAIVDALSAGDRIAAGRAMSRHILSAVNHWTRVLLMTADAPAHPSQGRTYSVQDIVAGDVINENSLSA